MKYGSTFRITIAGEPFTDYHYQNVKKPFFYPILGPDGVSLSRDYPMGYSEGEARDHPHHQSLWFGHGDIDGFDFWRDGRKERIVHRKFRRIASGEVGVIETENDYLSPDGELVVSDTRVIRIRGGENGSRILDFEVSFHAGSKSVRLGDTEEGSMAIRLNSRLRMRGEVAAGQAVNSEGVSGIEVWGKRAPWVDYSGPVDGRVFGVAIMDHPSNPRHPTWWHARPYGLFAANPFGIADFERKPRGTGDLIIEPGDAITFKWRFFFHRGDADKGAVASAYEQYSEE